MTMSSRHTQRLRERMSSRASKRQTAKYTESGTELPKRMSALEKDRKSFAHLRQSMIVPPRVLEWWEKDVVEYAFSHPHVRSRMERLMGSNITRLTDRKYMQRLAERIQEDHEATLEKRIRAREEAEVEREKKLILAGKIPVEQVPHELADHPVFKISRITSQAIESRRSKSQRPTMRMSYIPQDALTALARVLGSGGPVEEEVQAVHEQVAEYEAEQEAAEAHEIAQATATTLADLAVATAEVKEATKDMLEEVIGLADTAVQEGWDKKQEQLRQLREQMGEVSSEDEDEETEQKELPSEIKGAFPFEEILGEVEVMAERERVPPERSALSKRNAVLDAARKRREHRRRERKVFEKKEHFLAEELAEDQEALGRAVTQAAQRAEWEAEQEAEEEAALNRDRDYTLSEEDYQRLKYESPLIEQLRQKETVAELYALADEIVGGLWLGKAQRPSQMTEPAATGADDDDDDSKDV